MFTKKITKKPFIYENLGSFWLLSLWGVNCLEYLMRMEGLEMTWVK